MTDTGAHDFDFVFGRWVVHNRKLRDNSDPTCEEWVEFDATSEAWPLLRTGCHTDRIEATAPTDGEPFEGVTFRLYDPAAGTWRIWWSSTRAPGRLDEPVVGRFDGDWAPSSATTSSAGTRCGSGSTGTGATRPLRAGSSGSPSTVARPGCSTG